MRKWVLIFFSFVSVSYGKTLEIPYKPQSKPVWCWAAVSAMAINYFTGSPVGDKDLLDRYFKTDCKTDEECNTPGGKYEISEILSDYYHLNHKWVEGPISFEEVKSQIDSGHPLIVGLFDEENFQGHVVVVGGYESPDLVVIFDSLNPLRETKVSYQKLLKGYEGNLTWTDTLVFE